MEQFFRQLVLKLDKDRLHWRNDTIILLDNATYHNSAQMMQLLECLRIPIIFSGPHSYDAAPCELFFALFKSIDFNPQRLPLGKS